MFIQLLYSALTTLTADRLLRCCRVPEVDYYSTAQASLQASTVAVATTLPSACSTTTTATVVPVNDELKRLIERLEGLVGRAPVTATPSIQQKDNSIYNASAVSQCWSNNQDCQFTYQSVSTCYKSFGPLTDPNENQQSANYQGCLCGNLQWNVILEQTTPFFHCMECLRSAGVYGPLIDTTNANLNDFCATSDPNLFLWLGQFVNFILAIKPGISALWVSYSLPLSGQITQISALSPEYRLDTGANVPPLAPTDTQNITLFLASGASPPMGLSTEFSVIQTTVIVDPDTTITEQFTRSPTAPQIITFATTVQAMATSTLATHAGDQEIVLITPIPGVSTVVTTTATFGWPLGNVTAVPETLTVQRVKSEGARLEIGGWWRRLRVRARGLPKTRDKGPVVVVPQGAVTATTSSPEPTVPFGMPLPIAGGEGNGALKASLRDVVLLGIVVGSLWWVVFG